MPDAGFERLIRLTEGALESCLPLPPEAWGEGAAPMRLAEAMRYSLLAGGKRLRPVMLLAACEAAGGRAQAALPFAAALEMIHTYSLIHDDLPAMDNDDVRRGRPTNHKVFGEAMAVLAGDGLLTHAFQVMAASGHPRAAEVMGLFARCAGIAGMIAGQAADMDMQGAAPGMRMVRYIHARKTSALFQAAVAGGLMLAGAPEETVEQGKAYALHYGLAFQITDDLLDMQGNAALMGKTPGKDAAGQKLTWPAAVGAEQAREDARQHAQAALTLARALDGEEGVFAHLAKTVLTRVQ